jgi:hypothetical protein
VGPVEIERHPAFGIRSIRIQKTDPVRLASAEAIAEDEPETPPRLCGLQPDLPAPDVEDNLAGDGEFLVVTNHIWNLDCSRRRIADEPRFDPPGVADRKPAETGERSAALAVRIADPDRKTIAALVRVE